ncbi:TRAP transporter substrate-binding protein [Neolewinella lacunae]|uniref:TRAP transporter substrate-binding protein n=1 Tax=Neolewinella lacunae TaxID=1517758 RepID=UPI001FE8CF84|nr:TRAP transporter substrate-binding protein [Neolewinella lacunae]MDN3633139.1 TRAP transporter substrate-binding protein [Neolewinella lacunae]
MPAHPSPAPLPFPAPALSAPVLLTSSVRLLLLACALGCLFSCGEISEGKTLRLAHGLDVSHPVHGGMVRMGEVLDSISDGQLRLKIYSGGQLGTESQNLELLQLGSLAMTKVSAAVMERFAPAYSVLSLPYLFEDRETSFRVLDGPVGQELLAQGAAARLRGLTFFDAGTRSFYTKSAPVRTPADVVGKKVRVQNSPMAVDLIKSLGGSPTPISYGELYTALQQGVVDAAENNLPSYYTSRHYEVTPYYSYDRHTAVPDVLVIGTATWEKLSGQERDWLAVAARSATTFQRESWQAAEEEAVRELTKAGVTFTEVDAAAFRAAVEQMYTAARQDPDLAPILERILTAQ